MNYNVPKVGDQVDGTYCGVPFKGTVIDTRAKYGTDIQATVALDEEIEVHSTTRNLLLVNWSFDLNDYKNT